MQANLNLITNSVVFSWRLSDDADVMLGGKLLQTREATAGNAWSPVVCGGHA